MSRCSDDAFFIDRNRGAQDAAEHLRVRLITRVSERELDGEEKMHIIENLIQMRVDATCVTPSRCRVDRLPQDILLRIEPTARENFAAAGQP